MDQRKLYKTVEGIASRRFESSQEMLISVLNELIQNDQIDVIGGRIWKLDKENYSYSLLYQTGKLDRLEEKFQLFIKEYPVFDLIEKDRTILGSETNETLRQIGIFNYSASGAGEKVKLNGKQYYEYLLALNSEGINEEFRITLNIISTAVTSQIKQRRYAQRAKNFKADLDKARELQKSILPEHEYHYHNYILYGITDPAEIVGGDFFDYLDIGEDSSRLGVAVGDAASKGVSAAAEAMYISGALRMASNFEIKIYPLMKRMNRLVNKIFADDKFASLFYGELSHDNGGLFLYSSAGHNPPIFLKGDSDEVQLLRPTGPVLGPAPNAKYTVENINFSPGDVIIIYTDGLTDAADTEFNDYSEARLIEFVKKVKHLSPKEICYSVLEDVIRFSKNGKYSDDKTMVVIKRFQ